MKIKSGLTKNQGKEIAYFKNTLSEVEKKAYDAMQFGFFYYDVKIHIYGVPSSKINPIFDKVKRDNPLLYFVSQISYQHIPFQKEGIVIPTYRFDQNQIEATNSALYDNVLNLLTKCQCEDNAWNKEKHIHDFLCNTVRYDNQFKESSYECVGPLLFGRGVCEGISKACKYLFDLVGIESLIVHGRSKQRFNDISDGDSHAWNVSL